MLTQDINDNRAGVRTDELGMVTSSFVMGKATEQEGDLMDTELVETSAKDRPANTFEYDLFNYQNTGKPNFIKATVLDTHFYRRRQGQTPVAYTSYTYASGSGTTLMQKTQAEPGPVLQENADGTVTEIDTTPNIRWIGNGRVIINNKGSAVKQYEPYFSATFEFEDSSLLVERGVTPVITYDSAGRAVRTDFPNGTFNRVEFDSWKSQAHDQNDTVLESQWYADRIISPVAGIATPEEIAAAGKAKAHAGTPGLSYLDSLGRVIIVIADSGATGKLKSTIKLNIEGKALSVTDARGNVIAWSKYGMLGVPLYTQSPETGERWTVTDVVGNPLRGVDSKGNIFRYTFDRLHRPSGIFVKPGTAPEINLENTIYGEGVAGDKANNLRGKAYRHYNGAGLSTNQIYDFKGNQLQNSSQFCLGYKNITDWNDNPAIDNQVFTSSSTFDALNRVLTILSPDKSVYIPVYNEAGLVNSVEVLLRGAASKTNVIKSINYDVKGRQESIVYGNNISTVNKYNPLTERLVQLITTGSSGSNLLQKLSYTYDPAGNITTIKDEAQQAIYFKNSVVSASNDFTYDAIYRLISATGREHIGQNLPVAPNDAARINLPQPGDGTALRNYSQSYQYDAAGNILKMIHLAGTGGWTRTYNYEGATNRLTSEMVGSTTQSYQYDVHGNMNNIAQLNGLTWNLKDELQMADLGGGGKAYYVYAGGQRAKKVIERLDGTKETRLYLSGFEIYRRTDSTGKVLEETETLHVPDAAIVETKTIKNGVVLNEQLFRYQYSNHLGSVSLEADDKGAIISYEEYYPYGSTSYQAVNAAIKAAAKRYRYTGLEHDDETGMQYHSARYYLPWLGRWLSADPTGVKGGANLYEYAAGNPVMKNDRKGLQPDPADAEPELIGSEVIEVHGTAPKTDELSIQGKAGNSSVKTRDQFEDQEKREYFLDSKHLTPAQIAEYYDGHPERETAYYKGLQERYNKYWIYKAGDLEHQQRLVDAGANVGNYIVAGYAGAAVATVGAVAAASSLIALANSSAATTAAAAVASGGGGAAVLINELPDVAPEASEAVPAAAEAVAALTEAAPATVENFENAVTQVGTRLPEIVSDVYRYRRLDIIVVRTLDGLQGFYRSDGMFSKMANRWLPFDEIAIRWIRIGEADDDFYGDTVDWFNKDAYTEVAGFVENTPLYRFGTQTFKDVSDALGDLIIPKGINVDTKEEINQLLDFFGARITKYITERGF